MSEQLKNKLYNYHTQPSIETWNKIDIVLEKEREKTLSEKLINYQAPPPSFAWDNIASTLGEIEKTPVAPFTKRFSTLLKYGSAAAILIAVSMVLNLVFNKESISESAALPSVQQSTTTLSSPLPTKKTEDEISILTPETKNEQIAYSVSNKRKINGPLPLQINMPVSMLKDRVDQVVDHNYKIVEPEYLDRYIIFSKASGEAFRLSKKMFHLFACPDNDENCKENLESIQQRMADPSVVATGDFPAVLALLQNMNQ